jgi:hypothetical protein
MARFRQVTLHRGHPKKVTAALTKEALDEHSTRLVDRPPSSTSLCFQRHVAQLDKDSVDGHLFPNVYPRDEGNSGSDHRPGMNAVRSHEDHHCKSPRLYDYIDVCDAVDHSGFTITEIVSGRTGGVDTLGDRWAKENSMPVKQFPADLGMLDGRRKRCETLS